MSVKILIVDDSRVARMQVTTTLMNAGYVAVEAQDGSEALSIIQEQPNLSMVICDLNMPGMSGLELLAKVKANPERKSLPFVMLTTEARSALIEQAKSLGALGWMIKPVRPEPLLTAVKRVARAQAKAG